jgi:xylose isomerase
MSDSYSLKPSKSDRFSFGLWTIMNVGRDPFGEPTRPPIGPLDVIVGLAKKNVYSFELHAEDLVPMGASARQRDRLVREAKKRMRDYKIKCTNCGSNCFSHPVFKDGALTSHDPRIRAFAVQRYIYAIDMGYELGCRLCNLWWGRDGLEVEGSKDARDALKWLRECCNLLTEYVLKNYPDYELSIEPKPNEPRGDIFLPTTGHVLGFIATLDHPEKWGVVPELAHVRMAGLNSVHEVAQALDAGKLCGIHLNSQKPLRYDQDIRFGAEDLKESFFVVYLLETSDYQGTKSFDCHPYRTEDRRGAWDFVEGNMRTYLLLRDKVRIYQQDPQIQKILTGIRGSHKPLPSPKKIAETEFNLEQLLATRLPYEKLDQMIVELLLGAR